VSEGLIGRDLVRTIVPVATESGQKGKPDIVHPPIEVFGRCMAITVETLRNGDPRFIAMVTIERTGELEMWPIDGTVRVEVPPPAKARIPWSVLRHAFLDEAINLLEKRRDDKLQGNSDLVKQAIEHFIARLT